MKTSKRVCSENQAYSEVKVVNYISDNINYSISVFVKEEGYVSLEIKKINIVIIKLNNLKQINYNFNFFDENDNRYFAAELNGWDLNFSDKTQLKFIIEPGFYKINYFYDKNKNYKIDTSEKYQWFVLENETLLQLNEEINEIDLLSTMILDE